jgi:hypothetical protein
MNNPACIPASFRKQQGLLYNSELKVILKVDFSEGQDSDTSTEIFKLQ